MKKVFFLMAILFATVTFAQTGTVVEDTKLPGGFNRLQPTPCPPCPQISGGPVVVYPQPQPRIYPTSKPVIRKVFIGASRPNVTITNSGNTTINNYYREPAPQVVAHTTYTNHVDWMLPLLLILLLLILFGLVLIFKKENPASNGTHITVSPSPSASSNKPTVVVPPSSEELQKAMAYAKESGGMFSRGKDGGYDIDFQKIKGEEKK
jgi:hypothetical protein